MKKNEDVFYDALIKYYFYQLIASGIGKYISDAEKENAKSEMEKHCYTMMLNHQRISKKKERAAWSAACYSLQCLMNNRKAGEKK